MRSNKKIILVGGATAGHILPLVSVKKSLEKSGSFEFIYVGIGSDLEQRILANESLSQKKILCGKFRRESSLLASLKNIVDLFKTLIGFLQSFVIIASYKPDVIFSKSGFVAVPVTFAAKALSVPVVIHESDVVAGLATKVCANKCHAIITAFPTNLFDSSIRKKAIYGGLPIRDEFEHGESLTSGFVLITGGSQGAAELNERMLEVLPELLADHRVVHLTGQCQFKQFVDFKKSLSEKLQNKYEVKDFETNMADLMRKAKLVISRSGASAIFEIAALGKRCLLMPISSGVASHQMSNALFVEKIGGAKVIMPGDKGRDILKKIRSLLQQDSPNELNELYFPHSADYIARLLVDFLDFFALQKLKNVFMIGIGGVSMKGIASLLESVGIRVKGSDLKTGGHSKENINIGYDLVVYSSAADQNSAARVEHQKAHELKIKILKRSQMIGELMKGFRGISISGMHGKTTVTALISKMIEEANLDPSYLIGAPSSESSESSYFGSGIDFVCEACEYDGSFLDFKTKIAVVTNIEEEHLDYFKGGIKQIVEEFSRFVKSIYPGGALVFCQDDKNVVRVVEACSDYLKENRIKVVSYGFSNHSQVRIENYKTQNGQSTFVINGSEFLSSKIGEFFALDCAGAFAVGDFIGLGGAQMVRSVLDFKGAARRFEYIGAIRGVEVFDDYGHHPTEIRETLRALNEKFPKNRKIVIFQPHQQKRFNDFYDSFVEVLSNAPVDVIGVLPVYQVPGRDEKEIKSVDDLIKKINSPKIIPLDNFEMASNFIEENLKNNDILLTLGATDVYKIGRSFLKD